MEQTVQDTLQEHDGNLKHLCARLQHLEDTVQRLNREQITPVSEASAQAREVLG